MNAMNLTILLQTEVIPSTKGKKQLAYEGYIYDFQKKLETGKFRNYCFSHKFYVGLLILIKH